MRKSVVSVPQRQLVAFRLGRSEFALDVFAVHEILRYQPVTPLPEAPAFVEGVIDVRGTLLPVVDLRRRFEEPEPDAGKDTRIILIDLEGERLGLVVDRVTEVLRVPEPAIVEPPAFAQRNAAEYVDALVRLPDRLIVLLDLQRLLSTDERVALRDLEAVLDEARRAAADAEERARAEVPTGADPRPGSESPQPDVAGRQPRRAEDEP